MTLDAKVGADALVPDQENQTVPDGPRPYDTPVLIPLGNVHELLAGMGASMTSDGARFTHRQ